MGSKFFAVRVIAGKERQIIEKVATIARKKNLKIYSIVAPAELRGYFIVEADSRQDVLQAIYGMSHVKGVAKGEVSFKEIEHFLFKKKGEIKIEKGDIVEIISGPFKGEKAKVMRVDKVKEEVVVVLLEASVVIPITVKVDSVMLLKREEEEEK
ncbi:MAG TPA: transcription elongation factor Spt5 [Candidatus Aenigmarchaeota archaeon]|nr:transcription elongation factor Spt5 [Candidatus Aenigmarchaeota archaeon]